MNRAILRLAVPNVLSNISVPLLSTFDIALMGRLSAGHVAAVGLGAMIFNFVYWNFGFLRMGSTGLTAQEYGKGENGRPGLVPTRAAVVALILAAVLLVFQVPFAELSYWLLGIRAEQEALVDAYFYMRIWGAPAALLLYALLGFFFGMQNAVYPLILTFVINGLNIALSYYFVWSLGWGVSGLALGTVLAQYGGLLLGLGLLAYKYGHHFRGLRTAAVLRWTELRVFLQLNGDIFLRTLGLTLSFVFFYNISNRLGGDALLAANVLLLQLINWVSYGIDGFAFAAESLAGKYAGAQDPAGVRRTARYSFGWGMALAAGYSLVFLSPVPACWACSPPRHPSFPPRYPTGRG